MSRSERIEMANRLFRWGRWRNPRRRTWQRRRPAKSWGKKESGAGVVGGRRQVKDHHSNVQRGIFLHHWGPSWVREHAWLTPANRAAQVTGDVHRHRWSCQRHAVCLPALLFPRGQLCDSRSWHLRCKKASRWVRRHHTAPVSPVHQHQRLQHSVEGVLLAEALTRTSKVQLHLMLTDEAAPCWY